MIQPQLHGFGSFWVGGFVGQQLLKQAAVSRKRLPWRKCGADVALWVEVGNLLFFAV